MTADDRVAGQAAADALWLAVIDGSGIASLLLRAKRAQEMAEGRLAAEIARAEYCWRKPGSRKTRARARDC